MSIDIASLIISVILIGLGYRAGAMSQINKVVGVVLAIAAAPTVSALYKALWADDIPFKGAPLDWMMLAAASVSVFVVVAVLGWGLAYLLKKSDEGIEKSDKWIGGALGLLKALALVYLVGSVFLLVEDPLFEVDPDNVLRVRGSYLLDFMRDYKDVTDKFLEAAAERFV